MLRTKFLDGYRSHYGYEEAHRVTCKIFERLKGLADEHQVSAFVLFQYSIAQSIAPEFEEHPFMDPSRRIHMLRLAECAKASGLKVIDSYFGLSEKQTTFMNQNTGSSGFMKRKQTGTHTVIIALRVIKLLRRLLRRLLRQRLLLKNWIRDQTCVRPGQVCETLPLNKL